MQSSKKSEYKSMYSRFKEHVKEAKNEDVMKLLEAFEKVDIKSQNNNIVNFGKYKGSKISELMHVAAAREYFEWMLRQPWIVEEKNRGLKSELSKYDLNTGELKK